MGGWASTQPGVVGIKNFENTCYVNSGIQCLSHTTVLTEFLLENATSSVFKDISVAGEYVKLLQQIWSGKAKTVVPKDLKKTVDDVEHRFKGDSEQHDAFEFILFLLDKLHKATCELGIGTTDSKQTIPDSLSLSCSKSKSDSDRGRIEISQEKVLDEMDTSQSKALPMPFPSKRNTWRDRGLSQSEPSISYSPFSSGLVRTSSGTQLHLLSGSTSTSITDLDRGFEESGTLRSRRSSSPSSTGPKRVKKLRRKSKDFDPTCERPYLLMGGSSQPKKTDDGREEVEKMDEFAASCWNQHVSKKGTSICTEHFHGQTKHTFTCTVCHETAVTFYPFQYIDVPLSFNDPTHPGSIVHPSSLRQCLKLKGKGEKTREWLCPKCKTKKKATHSVQVWKHPTILMFRLGRVHSRKQREVKVSTSLTFPITGLRMPYCANDGSEKTETEVFDLYAVLSHVGHSAEQGHFIVHAQNHLDANWYTFNDSVVHPLHLTSNKFKSKEAYILFYRKRGAWTVASPRTDASLLTPGTPSPPSTPRAPRSVTALCYSRGKELTPPTTPRNRRTFSLDDYDIDLRKCSRTC